MSSTAGASLGLPYAESAPHLLTFVMGYILSQADISLHCPVTLTGAVAYVLSAHASDSVRQQFLHDVVRMDGLAKTGRHLGDRTTWRQRHRRDHHARRSPRKTLRAARAEMVHQQCQQRTGGGDGAS